MISKIDPAGLDIGQIGGRRNLIINGAMQVWQRGTSTTSGSDHFVADRWQTTPPAAVSTTTSQVFDTTLQQYMLKMALNADGGIQFKQEIEDFKWAHNKSLTLSFYAKSSTTIDATVSIRVRNSSQNVELDSEAVSITSALTKFTITLDAGDLSSYSEDSSSSIRLTFTATSLSNGDYIQIGQVQLEVGTVATPFEHRSYGEELALCQRYCYVINYNAGNPIVFHGYWGASTTFEGFIEFPVTMRSSPSLTIPTVGSLYALEAQVAWRQLSAVSIGEGSIEGVKVACTAATNNSFVKGQGGAVGIRASGNIQFDAEL